MPTTPNRRPINQNVDDARRILTQALRGINSTKLGTATRAKFENIRDAAVKIIQRNTPYDGRRTPTKETAAPYTTGASSKRARGRKAK